MEIKYNVSGSGRKKLVQAISEITGEPMKYLGAPTFAYEVGGITVDKKGMISFDNRVGNGEIDLLIERLCEVGFESEVQTEEMELVIQLPRASFTDASLKNLEKLVEAKGSLIKKALGVYSLQIEKDDECVSFPWFPCESDADEVKAYTHFISALCEMARNQKRITAKEKDTDNEKYAFRCFLLRLGFIGPEYKEDRKILLSKLTGSSAFRSPKSEASHDE